jgi:hypothetical protein
MKARVNVSGLTEQMWKELHEDAIQTFIDDSGLRFMVAFIDQYKGFIIEFGLPAYYVDQMTSCCIFKESRSIYPHHEPQ